MFCTVSYIRLCLYNVLYRRLPVCRVAWRHKVHRELRLANITALSFDEICLLKIVMELDDKLASKIHAKAEEPTLEDITKILEQEDLFKQNQKDLKQVLYVSGDPMQEKRVVVCFRCGASGHINRDCEVKAEDAYCDFCKVHGHLTVACRKKKREKNKKRKEQANQVEPRGAQGSPQPPRAPTRPPTPVGEGEEALLVECSVLNTSCQEHHTSLVRVTLDVMRSRRDSRGKVASAVLDTGCTVNLISDKLSDRLNLQPERCRTILTNASGEMMDVAGECFMWVKQPGISPRRIKVTVSKSMPATTEFLLGLPGLRGLGYLDKSFGSVKPVMMATEEPQPMETKATVHRRPGRQESTYLVTAQDLFNPIGTVEDMPHLLSLPAGIQQLLHRFKGIFSPHLERNRYVKTEPAKIELNDTPLPPPCQKTRQIPHHWQDKARAII